jgi:hypothetical protein
MSTFYVVYDPATVKLSTVLAALGDPDITITQTCDVMNGLRLNVAPSSTIETSFDGGVAWAPKSNFTGGTYTTTLTWALDEFVRGFRNCEARCGTNYIDLRDKWVVSDFIFEGLNTFG